MTETLPVQVFLGRDALELAHLLGSPPQRTRVVGCHGGSYKGTWWLLQGHMVVVTRAHGGSYKGTW